jgi:superfamily II DNA or RNA helicase
MNAHLHPHQSAAIDGVWQSFAAGHRRSMLELPTGAGKTVIAQAITSRALAKGRRVAFCVPFLGLIDQTFERFVQFGIDPADIGVIQADHPWRRPGAKVQICSGHTLANRGFPAADLVIIDEAHRHLEIYRTWMDACPQVYFLGLSATPWTKGLGKHYDHLIRPTSIEELIEMGLLSPFRVFAPSVPDLAGIKVVNGDYHEGQLEERMSDAVLVADIVETWLKRAKGLPTICFAAGRAHARQVAEKFAQAGVPTAYIDAFTPREERAEIGEQLASGSIEVVVNIATLTTGIDWDVRCLILARPTRSAALFVQMIGRGLRTAPGKDACLILDHSDTHQRLGMVTDIVRETLDDGSKADSEKREREAAKTPLPKCCPSCTALMPINSRKCISCGHEMPAIVKVEMRDGELTEFASKKPKPEPALKAIQKMGKPSVLGQLKGLAIRKGRDPVKWVRAKYRAIFDTWPQAIHTQPPEEPTPELESYVRHLDIAWAKSRTARSETVNA